MIRTARTATRQHGFTLVELVVVIAIMGVLAAVAVPMITNYLSNAKQRAYNAERDRIQQAVDAYYSAPDNVRFIGKRQYPIIGKGQTDQAALTNRTTAITLKDTGDPFTAQDHDANADTATVELWNPVGGTQGADLSAAWADGDTDGIRDIAAASPDTWTGVSVTRGGVTYYTYASYFFINFESLTTANLLEDIPESASSSNKPEGSTKTYTGSYVWYVDLNGKVKSLYVEFPSTSAYVTNVFP